MAELFYKLGYNFDDPNGYVGDFSSNVISHLENVPSVIEDWQSQDIADDNVGGYLQNPVGTVTQNISSSANNIIFTLSPGANVANIPNLTVSISGTTPTINTVFQNILNVASSLYLQSSDATNGFKAHTDRVSGVTNFTDYLENTTINEKPFYNTIMAYSKVGVYIMYQTDEVSNSSTVLGSMTSILIKPQLDGYSNTISTYANTINSSITAGVSNMTLTAATEIYNNLANTNNLMNTRRTHDENFFTNLRTLIGNYNNTRQFSRMGETQLDLMNSHIGTDKLKDRIN